LRRSCARNTKYTYRRLSWDNAAVLLADHQSGLVNLEQGYSPDEFRNNVLALAGRKQLLIAGALTEVCVAFPVLSAQEEGFDVFVVTDASGTFNEVTRYAAWMRMAAGMCAIDELDGRCQRTAS